MIVALGSVGPAETVARQRLLDDRSAGRSERKCTLGGSKALVICAYNLEARKQIIFAIQRYVAEQQYKVYLACHMLTGSWQPYVKNYAPNQTLDFGGRAAALWLER
jgi:hypothetical protein